MKKNILVLFSSSIILLSGCSGGGSNNGGSDKAGLFLSFKQADSKPASGDGAEYLVSRGDLNSGEISAQGAGVEQIGWNYYYPVGNTLFVTGYTNKNSTSYKLEGKKLKKMNEFVYENPLEMYGNVNNSLMLASDQPRDGAHTHRTLYTASGETGKLVSKIKFKIDGKDTGTPGKGWVAVPHGLLVRGDKLFMPFGKIDDNSGSKYSTPEPDKAVLAVFKYPLKPADKDSVVKPEKIIEDTRTSQIGVNGNPTNIIKADNGDIYTFSNGSTPAGFKPASTKPSGILRIKNGQTDFDKDYFFDIESVTDGGKIFWFGHIGGNKVLARITQKNAKADKEWYSASYKKYFTMKLALIDLDAKTLEYVKDVPVHHKRWTSPIEIINGKVYLSIETKDNSHIYEYDIATNKAKKGAKITGKTVKGVYDLAN